MIKKSILQAFNKALLKACFSLLAISVSGCSTIYTQVNTEENDCGICLDTPRLYSGTAYNLCYLSSSSPMTIVNIIDLPLSLIADTIISPYTGYQQYKKGSICSEEELDDIK